MQVDIDENQPSLRLCDVERPSAGSCGFHLTRTAWDPYPWVSGVEPGSAAEAAGLQAGDCVLEVNGEDVLGQRIGDVASKVRARDDRVTLLLWNAGSDPHTAATSVSAGVVTREIEFMLVCGSCQPHRRGLGW
jgi:C-terminal processing protease CtpA/Prc